MSSVNREEINKVIKRRHRGTVDHTHLGLPLPMESGVLMCFGGKNKNMKLGTGRRRLQAWV